MKPDKLSTDTESRLNVIYDGLERSTSASYERQLVKHRLTETRLRAELSRDEALLQRKDGIIRQQEILSKESDHRLLNGMQMIVSLLSLQSRAAINPEVASQLTVAANRVATIARVHRQLHSLDGVQTVAFKQFLTDLCHEIEVMLPPGPGPASEFVVEGVEIMLPTTIGIPLGFIINELITNAAKYGKGRIAVRLEPGLRQGYAVSVSNDGPALPDDFDPAASKGLGMKIVRMLIHRIGGELRIARGDGNQGARFTVLLP